MNVCIYVYTYVCTYVFKYVYICMCKQFQYSSCLLSFFLLFYEYEVIDPVCSYF